MGVIFFVGIRLEVLRSWKGDVEQQQRRRAEYSYSTSAEPRTSVPGKALLRAERRRAGGKRGRRGRRGSGRGRGEGGRARIRRASQSEARTGQASKQLSIGRRRGTHALGGQQPARAVPRRGLHCDGEEEAHHCLILILPYLLTHSDTAPAMQIQISSPSPAPPRPPSARPSRPPTSDFRPPPSFLLVLSCPVRRR